MADAALSPQEQQHLASAVEATLQIPKLAEALQTCLRFVGETQHVFSHLRHVYRVFVAELPHDDTALAWTHCLPEDGKRCGLGSACPGE